MMYHKLVRRLEEGKHADVAQIRRLVRDHPDAAKGKDAGGDTPLHIGMANQAPAEAIVAVLAAWPDAAKEKNMNGSNPLHIGMKKQVPAEAITAVVAACPFAATEKNKVGDTPLNIGMWKQAPAEAIVAVLAAWPDAAKGKDAGGSTPLHIGMANQAPAEAIVAVLPAWPDAAKEKNQGGDTPLYVGMANQAPAEAIVAVLAAWPDAAKEKDAGGSTPLYIGMANQAPAEAVVAVLEAWPDAAKGKDVTRVNGSTPLHIGMANQAPAEAIVAVLAAWPDAAKRKNKDGDTPLLIGMANQAPSEAIMAVLAAWPDAAKEKNINGSTPLHFGMANQAPAEVIVAVLAAWPDAAKEKNQGGDTPLHLGMRKQALAEAIVAVLAAWPDAVKEKDEKGWTPLHWGIENSTICCFSGAALLAVLQTYPKAAVIKSTDGQTLLDVWQSSNCSAWWGRLIRITMKDAPVAKIVRAVLGTTSAAKAGTATFGTAVLTVTGATTGAKPKSVMLGFGLMAGDSRNRKDLLISASAALSGLGAPTYRLSPDLLSSVGSDPLSPDGAITITVQQQTAGDTFSAAMSRQSRVYRITVVTGAERHAGTSAKITLAMTGTLGFSGPLKLDDKHWTPKSNGTRFDKDSSDVFEFELQDLGEVGNVKVSSDGSRAVGKKNWKHPEWYLELVTIEASPGQLRWVLPAGRWLSKKDGLSCELEPTGNGGTRGAAMVSPAAATTASIEYRLTFGKCSISPFWDPALRGQDARCFGVDKIFTAQDPKALAAGWLGVLSLTSWPSDGKDFGDNIVTTIAAANPTAALALLRDDASHAKFRQHIAEVARAVSAKAGPLTPIGTRIKTITDYIHTMIESGAIESLNDPAMAEVVDQLESGLLAELLECTLDIGLEAVASSKPHIAKLEAKLAESSESNNATAELYRNAARLLDDDPDHSRYLDGAAAAVIETEAGHGKDPRQPMSLLRMLMAAPAAEKVFRAEVEAIAKDCGAELSDAKHGNKFSRKGIQRIVEKAMLKVAASGSGSVAAGFSGVRDPVRCMFICPTAAIAINVQTALRNSKVLQPVRWKNRYAGASAGGWRDELVNLRIRGEGKDGLIMEAQVVRQELVTMREGMQGHHIYDYRRGIEGLVKACGGEVEDAGDSAEVTKLQDEVAELRARIAELERKSARDEVKNNRLKCNNAGLNSKIAALVSENAALKSDKNAKRAKAAEPAAEDTELRRGHPKPYVNVEGRYVNVPGSGFASSSNGRPQFDGYGGGSATA